MLARCSSQYTFSPFKLIGGLVVLAMGFASVAGLFDGPDVASAAQFGITSGMLEAHYYVMRFIGAVGVFTASTNLYKVARRVTWVVTLWTVML